MNIALIAHDGKKADLVSFVLQRMKFFKQKELTLIATGTTGKMIMDAGVDHIQRVASGPLGGDAEIGAMEHEEKWTPSSFLETHWISTHTTLTFPCYCDYVMFIMSLWLLIKNQHTFWFPSLIRK